MALLQEQQPATSLRVGLSRRDAASWAGVAYLAIFGLAIFANFFAIQGVLEPGNATATAANIRNSEGVFRAGVASFMVVFVLDVVIAWALNIFFRDVNADLSLLAGWFRVVGATLLGASLIFLILVLELLSGASYLAAFDQAQLDAEALLFMHGFDLLWLTGLVCFGVHLIVLGLLTLKSGWMPKLLAYLLFVAGAAYIADTLARVALANYDDFETAFLIVVAVPSIVAELWLALWLLLRGGKEAAAA